MATDMQVMVGAAVGVVLLLVVVALVLRRVIGTLPAPSRSLPPTMPRADLLADTELRRYVGEQNLIAAIKRVRDLTGMGLKDAKDYAEVLLRAPDIPPPDPPAVPDQAYLAAEARRIRTERTTIEAIRWVRQQTGMGLKAAKDFVESL